MKLPSAQHANLAATSNRALSEVKMRLKRRSTGMTSFAASWRTQVCYRLGRQHRLSDSLGNEEQTTANVVKQGAMTMRKWWGRPLIVWVGLVLTATLNPGTGNAEYRGGTIKIGVLNDQSGLYADIAGTASIWMARKAVEDFGAAAKGMKVEIIGGDHQNKPDIGLSIARQWFDVDKVDAIADVPTSSVALAVNELTRDKNKVFLAVGPATSDLTGKACSPNTVHWIYDTWALANGTGNAIVKRGGDTWFFLTADYAFGHALERDTEAVVVKSGGKVLGKVRHPFPGTDFSSFLLQAKASKAKIIGLANAGGDTINSIKQASEFGIVEGGQKLAGLLIFINDIHALGLKTAQGLIFTDPWYWDQNDTNRAFAREYFAALGRMPGYTVVGVYSAVIHYLRAVEALGSHADGKAVIVKMKELPTDDRLMGKGSVRIDGRKIHPMYLFEVKKPEESKASWDYYKQLATIPAEEAWRPLDQSECALVKK
jgi:branched-chain amino acid transport system substrate-binding protein